MELFIVMKQIKKATEKVWNELIYAETQVGL